MEITRYERKTDGAKFNSIRVDYGSRGRVEFSFGMLNTKGQRWVSNGDTKAKLIQLDKHDGISMLGLYIGRVGLVFLRGKVKEGM